MGDSFKEGAAALAASAVFASAFGSDFAHPAANTQTPTHNAMMLFFIDVNLNRFEFLHLKVTLFARHFVMARPR
jgi:hypothetical protein